MVRTDYLAVAHKAPADVASLPEYFDLLEAGVVPAAVEYALTLVLVDRFPLADHAEPWEVAGDLPTVAALWLQGLDQNSAGANDALLARWAATGSLDDLAELIRRAMNRDGSNVADSVGSDALHLLAEAEQADPALAGALAANNFSLGRLRFGAFPPGSIKLPLTADPAKPMAAGARILPTSGAPASGAALVAQPVAQVPYSAGPASADLASGRVLLGSSKLSVTAALGLRDAITRAVLELTRPAEGFQWVDDTADPQVKSSLFDLDTDRGEGLPQVPGGLLAAEVNQVPALGPDPNAGKYTARIYNRAGGFAEFMTDRDDINAAKTVVADRVRAELK